MVPNCRSSTSRRNFRPFAPFRHSQYLKHKLPVLAATSLATCPGSKSPSSIEMTCSKNRKVLEAIISRFPWEKREIYSLIRMANDGSDAPFQTLEQDRLPTAFPCTVHVQQKTRRQQKPTQEFQALAGSDLQGTVQRHPGLKAQLLRGRERRGVQVPVQHHLGKRKKRRRSSKKPEKRLVKRISDILEVMNVIQCVCVRTVFKGKVF